MNSRFIPPYQMVTPPGWADSRLENLSEEMIQSINQGSASPILNEAMPDEDAITESVITLLKRSNVEYGDLRLGTDYRRYLFCQDHNLKHHSQSESRGIGIRILDKGFWGFASTSILTKQGIETCVKNAVDQSRFLASVSPADLAINMEHWAHEQPHIATHHTPLAVCPLAADTEQICQPFFEATDKVLGQEHISDDFGNSGKIYRVNSHFTVLARRRTFANTDGAKILTTLCITDGEQKLIALENNTSAYRRNSQSAKAGGLEHHLVYNYPDRAEGAAKEAIAKCFAKAPDSGQYNLILDGSNLALTMHESVGHPTELDRVLGDELSLAGGSFASLDKLGKFQYASPIVNFTADNRIMFGGATQGYDDEGVACQTFPVIKEGILVGYGTSRENAHRIGLNRSNGTCRATNWWDTPITRIPNLYLEPGTKSLTLEQLIADTDDGILMLGRDSFSIDQMRYNFQFGADMSYRIKGGKIIEPLKDVIYQSISPDFWNKCDAICDHTEWKMHGFLNCGKGHPVQIARMMHGAAPARFTQIQVGF